MSLFWGNFRKRKQIMATLSNSQRKNLEDNPNVLRITGSNVIYTGRFKIKAVKAHFNGSRPDQIFLDAGIDLSLFGKDYAKKAVGRWGKIHEELGNNGLTFSRRGHGAKRCPKKKFNSLEEELCYLREENDFLKKLHALAAKYQKKKDTL